ncbi:tetratricopeptide repeat protein [Dokdonia ponticola]|uniref:Tetratricopeptide repeat protein n=1 Tax=Dokdonia ponticola TaxID=2041041 RepID=A0ABV9HVP6_9FLAO
MKRNLYILLLFLCLSMLSRKHIYAQDLTPFADQNVDDLGDVSDEFQETFFEALKQKGIENYELAITALNRCIAMEPTQAILYFERGKNYEALKKNDLAEEDFLKTLSLKPNEEAVLEALYELYYKSKDYGKAENTVKQLIPFDSQYKEDLSRIYTATKRYDEALQLLDALDSEKGGDPYRDQLRDRIYTLSGNEKGRTDAIEKKIASNPTAEADYLKLIYLYSEQGETQKAYETALKLKEINPTAEEVNLALYKLYLDDGKTEDAILAMKNVLKSNRITPDAKHRVLNDFLLFANKNPQYEGALEEAILLFDSQVAGSKIYQELANYFISKGAKSKALPYLKKALENDPDNIEVIKKTLLLQLDTGAFQDAEEIAASALELYPSQPLLYLTYGVALNKQSKFKEAIDQLEIGIDYIIDDTRMESDFYQQLGDAYAGTGNVAKAQQYIDKANALKAQNNK